MREALTPIVTIVLAGNGAGRAGRPGCHGTPGRWFRVRAITAACAREMVPSPRACAVSSNPELVTAHNGWAATASNAARVRARAPARPCGDPEEGGVTAALDMYQT